MCKSLIMKASCTCWGILLILCSWLVEAAAPQRIVSLKPNITEILFAVGAGDRVVGVTTWCNYPAEASNLPKVADYIAPNLEKTLAVRPDLVIGSKENSLRQPVDRLETAGVRVALYPFDTVAATIGSIRDIGVLVGAEQAAQSLIARMHHALSTMRHTYGLLPEPRVLIVVGHTPLVAAGPHSFLGDLLDKAHAENIVTTTVTPYPHLTRETIIVRNPEVIIDLAGGMGEKDTHSWKSLSTVAAVRNQRIVVLSTDLFRPGPRLVEGLQTLAKAIHNR